MKIIDSHAQFMSPSELVYPWAEDDEAMHRPHTPDDLPITGADWELEKIVAVEARCLPEQWKNEVNWLMTLAKSDPRISAIVAYAPLENHNFHAVLEILGVLPQVRGVRRTILGEKPGFAATEHFMDAVRLLADYDDLTFELLASIAQMDEIIALVNHASDVKIAVNDLAVPLFAEGMYERWTRQIERLAPHENVYCKIATGINFAGPDVTWGIEVIRPYLERLLRIFGPERLMFAGDYLPLQTQSVEYGLWVNTVMGMFSEAEQQQVFYDNANQFYGLP